MKYLLDTCVISEVIKREPNKNVISWLQAQDEANLFLSILTFGEIQKGIQKDSDQNRKKRLKMWVEEDLKKRFENRIIPIDLKVVTNWGSIQGLAELAGRTIPTLDGLIAVSGLTYNCTVATRNISDMEQSTAELFNPWEYKK
ncbi:type II toxin-antitoxin system VapC family toxin [uncultured Thiothrix sp.]|jgi:predicted nucleic acid-binding protein|uniref:type II toxin-antitoxin system VapC family toxin n=1 Tax=uncultured Thiothrix sp. TaxID=223185 RepID=UPI00260A14A2|nr:type II toxin-antitoxin system VapC family toxin [uncultured Thiothrix sp.]HMT94546.1 type II toxin-antitoxin system VapC family toxin [Thiolinea sp.]